MPHVESASPHVRPTSILKQQQQQHQYQEQQHDEVQLQEKQQNAQSTMAPRAYLGLVNHAGSPTPKSVSIAQHTDTISPLILGRRKSVEEFNFNIARDFKKPVVKGAKAQRLAGRLSTTASPLLQPLTPQTVAADDGEAMVDGSPFEAQPQMDSYQQLIDQISAWIIEERAKRSNRGPIEDIAPDAQPTATSQPSPNGRSIKNHKRRDSDASHKSLDLDKLEGIVKQNLNISRRRAFVGIKRKSSIRKLRRKPSSTSDSEFFDGDPVVPSCDAVLDNSNTIASKGGAPESDMSSSDELKHTPSYRDQDAWASFKFEIIRLAHTLRLKGWRRVMLEMSSEITVQRLSGALTNAVYVVSPPQNLLEQMRSEDGQSLKKPPPKLLLRIYGPQAEHLIDREAELAILRRLARKRIGPRLLGTFANGRFEEYFHARPLNMDDLRHSDTSRQIAKRMRELHDGVELLDSERSDGAFVWRNWDKWLLRVEQIVSWMDEQVQSLEPGTKPTGSKAWLRRGYICGVPWKVFRETVDRYRAWLISQYGGMKEMQNQLVFAHNDTQYGNILRLVPTGESPLLLPANTHKQLVVIDFEYASANSQGLEFANHFTEWCYNYHDKRKPYACNTNRYPTPDEQDRFIRAYVQHRPQYNINTPKLGPIASPGDPAATPREPGRRPTTNISDFMLDARVPYSPSAGGASADDAAVKAAEDAEVTRLIQQTRLWRLANTAQWVAWGIIQAKVPDMPRFEANEDEKTATEEVQDIVEDEAHELLAERAESYKTLTDDEQQQQQKKSAEREEEQEEFDYLGYAQHRAMFFWGDALQLGLVKEEDLPEEMRAKIKMVTY